VFPGDWSVVRRGKEIDALWACTSRQIRHVLDLATVERDPTTVDRKGFVTLKVMSVRPVFSHSPITEPRRMMSPFDPARGCVGPTSAL
jgi:hypothetical protein